MSQSRAGRLGYDAIGTLVRVLGRVVWRIEVIGAERIPLAGGAVLAPIHRSNLDFLLAAVPTRRRVRWMAKHTIFSDGRTGAALIALGAFPVRRGTPDRTALRACEQMLASGELVVMFPEGTRCSGDEIQPFFRGPAFMATQARVPLVPIGIGGSERSMPRGAKMIRPTKIVITVGEPIYPDVELDGRATRTQLAELTETLAVEVQRQFDAARGRVGE